MPADIDIEQVRRDFERLEREVAELRDEFAISDTEEPLSEDEFQTCCSRIAALDDEMLIFTTAGILSEIENTPGWGRTLAARTYARVGLGEILARWAPTDAVAAAFERFADDDDAARRTQ